MHIRESTEQDIPAIVDLLKKSLGESSSPKSINYWIWKHVKNPFGPSKVLLAERNGQLIGIRAMMQWIWQRENQPYTALRAVDTATHPDFQGQGVFSVLTQKMVDRSKNDGINFIFNTPNEKSLPGYLKLGWVSLQKLPVGISFLTSLSFISRKSIHGSLDLDKIELLCNRWNLIQQKITPLFTPKSLDYLKWRYLDNPVIKYFVFADAELFLAMYSRKRNNITELRVAELICLGSTPSTTKRVRTIIRNYAIEKKINLITFAPVLKRWMPGLTFVLPLGPKLCAKKINVDMPAFSHIKFAYTLGDMELF